MFARLAQVWTQKIFVGFMSTRCKIVASYHCIQFQGNLMIQTQETRNKIRISSYKEIRETYSKFTGKILMVIAKFQKIFLFLEEGWPLRLFCGLEWFHLIYINSLQSACDWVHLNQYIPSVLSKKKKDFVKAKPFMKFQTERNTFGCEWAS